ncbi:hypothetical protein SKAU_G00324070 [Synaphobranchus kaupii]|uniref:Uncharacterized protein n=1 Tax=Synaphobranchus kaupii TaxID=118154 RepID=A0A9Q1IK66_SYNKA|nr:hypothetical protein SKAU_G00324070 [Synaphobranchus kaupii]
MQRAYSTTLPDYYSPANDRRTPGRLDRRPRSDGMMSSVGIDACSSVTWEWTELLFSRLPSSTRSTRALSLFPEVSGLLSQRRLEPEEKDEEVLPEERDEEVLPDGATWGQEGSEQNN